MRTRTVIKKLIEIYEKAIREAKIAENDDQLWDVLSDNKVWSGVCLTTRLYFNVRIFKEPWVLAHLKPGGYWTDTPKFIYCMQVSKAKFCVIDALVMRLSILKEELKNYPWYKPGSRLKQYDNGD